MYIVGIGVKAPVGVQYGRAPRLLDETETETFRHRASSTIAGLLVLLQSGVGGVADVAVADVKASVTRLCDNAPGARPYIGATARVATTPERNFQLKLPL
jgi:hypothetical protein